MTKRRELQKGANVKFLEGKKLSKILKFHLTSIKRQSSFQGQLEQCICLLFFVFLTIKLKSCILTCRFFNFILVSTLLNLDFIADISRLLVLKKDQINKLFVCLFNQYDLAQVVNIISQVGLNIDFSESFSGC